jgi:hypothetical protein
MYYKDSDKPKIIDEIMANTMKYTARFRKAWSKERKWIYNDPKDLAKYVNTIDVYSLGAAFIRIDEEYLRRHSRRIDSEFDRLVNDMIAVNPAKRLSPEDLLTRAKNILDK